MLTLNYLNSICNQINFFIIKPRSRICETKSREGELKYYT